MYTIDDVVQRHMLVMTDSHGELEELLAMCRDNGILWASNAKATTDVIFKSPAFTTEGYKNGIYLYFYSYKRIVWGFNNELHDDGRFRISFCLDMQKKKKAQFRY